MAGGESAASGSHCIVAFWLIAQTEYDDDGAEMRGRGIGIGIGIGTCYLMVVRCARERGVESFII